MMSFLHTRLMTALILLRKKKFETCLESYGSGRFVKQEQWERSPPLSSPFPLLPLEVGPQIQLWGLGSAVSSPSGVWGGAPAEIEFGAF